MLYQGEELFKLMPQRNPIVMVDKILDAEGDTAHTGLTVTDRNYFLEEDGRMAEPGLIEHIAQSASAFKGHKALLAGEPLPIGYIGEVKKFHCYVRPAVGDELTTTVTLGAEVNGVTLMTGETRCGEVLVADTQMKIFVE
ncbi:MAG: beta-hydroxyacyl-ACP dehydratase [Bacteroidales bacterium]|nr:beta-hydroxyacyl-ACP dehydratase [Bacteroidales bacterium]